VGENFRRGGENFRHAGENFRHVGEIFRHVGENFLLRKSWRALDSGAESRRNACNLFALICTYSCANFSGAKIPWLK
jgi:hypothetical protein